MQMVNSCSANIQCDVSVDITATAVVRRGCQNVIAVVTITSETNDAVPIVLLMNMSDVSFIYGRL